MTEQIQWKTIDQIFCKSMRCRKCFDQKLADSALIDVAQPRWIGPRYFKAPKKILIITQYPGVGTPKKQQADDEFSKILHEYKDGTKTRQALFTFQKHSIPKWGRTKKGETKGSFFKFYMDGMELCLDEVAFVNIAWCATDNENKHPAKMLSQCFTINTRELIKVIKPDVAILSGKNIHKYYSHIEAILPTCHVVQTWNYAHRKRLDDERIELQRVRKEIAAVH